MTDDTAVDDPADASADDSSEHSSSDSAEDTAKEEAEDKGQDSAEDSASDGGDEESSDGSSEDEGRSDEAKLEELGSQINRARSRAEENVEGVAEEEPSGPSATGTGDEGDKEPEQFHESGESESEDDQAIAPPG